MQKAMYYPLPSQPAGDTSETQSVEIANLHIKIKDVVSIAFHIP
jgi:hypothetical protein